MFAPYSPAELAAARSMFPNVGRWDVRDEDFGSYRSWLKRNWREIRPGFMVQRLGAFQVLGGEPNEDTMRSMIIAMRMAMGRPVWSSYS